MVLILHMASGGYRLCGRVTWCVQQDAKAASLTITWWKRCSMYVPFSHLLLAFRYTMLCPQFTITAIFYFVYIFFCCFGLCFNYLWKFDTRIWKFVLKVHFTVTCYLIIFAFNKQEFVIFYDFVGNFCMCFPSNHTHTQPFYGSVWILSGTTQVSWYQKKHSPTHTYCGHQSFLCASSIRYNPWHPLCSIYMPDSLFPQYLSKSILNFSFQILFVLMSMWSFVIMMELGLTTFYSVSACLIWCRLCIDNSRVLKMIFDG